jgi:hypothetical protein
MFAQPGTVIARVRKKHPDRIDQPIVDIRASVKAKAVRFEESPETRVEFLDEAVDRTSTDQPEVEAGSATERVNIPEQAEPGITYRDVRVRWHLAAKVVSHRDDH